MGFQGPNTQEVEYLLQYSKKCCPPMSLMVVASMVPMVETLVSPLASMHVASVPPMWAGLVVAASMRALMWAASVMTVGLVPEVILVPLTSVVPMSLSTDV